MDTVNEVFEDLMEKFGDELFDITHQENMSEDDAEKVMTEFTEKVGKYFGDD
jgi:hypothetical protein